VVADDDFAKLVNEFADALRAWEDAGGGAAPSVVRDKLTRVAAGFNGLRPK
jgi:hypothetical protein